MDSHCQRMTTISPPTMATTKGMTATAAWSSLISAREVVTYRFTATGRVA